MTSRFSSITSERHPTSQERRSAARNKSRSRQRANHRMQFVGVDGEGINIVTGAGTEHRYVMLSVGDETLWNHDGLTHREILPFLYEQHLAQPHAVFVGFYLGYDFTMWLKSLDEHQARMLFTPEGVALRKPKRSKNPSPFPVYVDGWELDILGMKRLRLRPAVADGEKAHSWMYVCDTGAFWQASFLSVIEPSEKKWPNGTAPCTDDEYATVVEGKNSRADTFAADDKSYVAAMANYNRLENRILARAMSVLNDGFVQVGVLLSRDNYYGPGQAIQKWLDKVAAAGAFLHHDMIETIPEWCRDVGRRSYYGGWFETPVHGHIPGVAYEYDLISAYPHAMRNLPCLCGGWEQGTNAATIPDNASFVFVHAGVKGSSPVFGPLPFRNPKGNILKPPATVGWYLLDEIDAAHRAELVDNVHIDSWVAYLPCSHESPLAGLAELYLYRQRIGKATPAGKAVKLMLNSAYGKFAQSIGNPKYGNPIYAALITAHTRIEILNAIASHPEGAGACVMVATDGVYFSSPHPGLDKASGEREVLGGWERAEKPGLTIMKPGVYWDDESRRVGAAKVKSRGISAKALSEAMGELDAAFSELLTAGELVMPSLTIKVPFSVTSPRLALARGKWATCGCVEYDAVRRDSASVAPKRCGVQVVGGVVRSFPMSVPTGSETTPYPRRFGFDVEDDAGEVWGLTPDGTVVDAYRDIIRGTM